MSQTEPLTTARGSATDVFLTFLMLGLTSFGGPVAHLGFFRDALVTRRKWLSEAAFADLVALCQFLPGPASSQVGMAIGLGRAGYAGMFAAWLAFTLPSAILLVGFAYAVSAAGLEQGGWLHGLKAAAVAVVANAVLGMATTLTPDRQRATIALAGMLLALLAPNAFGQLAAIAAGALIGLVWLRMDETASEPHEPISVGVSRPIAVACLIAFVALLALLPLAASINGDGWLRMADSFYRAGALVFGGGHVVLPLLDAETVGAGLVTRDAFLAGYGAAQAVPGPLFTFAGYLGAVQVASPNGAAGATLALVAIFLPSALLVIGALPFWERLRASRTARRALMGTNAAVVGLLAAALYDPVFTQGVTSPSTMAIAAASFVALAVWRLPAWAVVIACGLLGYAAL
ncbi:MAG: chromate efflux transporter [Rhizobiaceae bacterium]